MRSRLTRLSWAAFWIVTLSSIAVGTCALVLYHFPWMVVSSNFGQSESSAFLTPWPVSSKEEDRATKKNLKRFPAAEQKRRLATLLQRMKVINSPVVDVFLDPNLQVISQEAGLGERSNLFAWPFLETLRPVQYEHGPKPLSYFVVPSTHGSTLVEGLLLKSGDELRVNVPLVKNKRNLSFSALPTTPGTVRVILGQHTWTKNFTDAEVNILHSITVPINDATANAMRIMSVSSDFYFGRAVVSQRETTGRLPVQVAQSSPLWKTNPLHFEHKKVEAPEVEEVSPAEEHVEAPPLAESTDVPPEPTAKPTPIAGEITDANEERANKQIYSATGKTIAVGYNVLLLQLGDLPPELLSNAKLMRQVAPNLFGYMENALSLTGTSAGSSSDDLFRSTVLGPNFGRTEARDESSFRHKVENYKASNLYLQLRNYGYYTMTIAPASTLLLNPAVGEGKKFPKLAGRWLGPNDNSFVTKNRELEELAEPVSGLEAVFNTRHSETAFPISDPDLLSIGDYLSATSKSQKGFPDWGANEIFIPDSRELYFPRLLDKFQNWTKDNLQTRFFAHLYMDPSAIGSSPSIKDFAKLAKAKKFGVITQPAEVDALGKVALLDRTFGQILETLYFKKLEHRTIVAVVIPQQSAEGNRTQFLLKVPGLLPANGTRPQADMQDMMATILESVGIPATDTPGHSLEVLKTAEVAPSVTPEKIHKYTVFVRPGRGGCGAFQWTSESEIFGIESTEPVVEFNDPNALRFYPCAIQKEFIKVSWFQKAPSPKAEGVVLATKLSEFLGGHFIAVDKEIPRFLFGSRLLSSTSLPFSLVKTSAQNLKGLLNYNETADDQTILEQLEILENSEPQGKEKTTVLFWRKE